MAYMCIRTNKSCDACGCCIREPQYIKCDICGEKIYYEEEYYNVDGIIYCTECMGDNLRYFDGE